MFALMRASGENRRLVAVQALVTDLHAPVAVRGWERLEPWAVARVLLEGPGATRTAVVKWVRDGPAQVRSEPWRLRAELAALQFLSQDLGLALAPRVIAADARAGLLVMEDLAPRVAGDPAAAGLADQYRRALARGVPEAQDDRRYGFALASACMRWALLRLHRFAVTAPESMIRALRTRHGCPVPMPRHVRAMSGKVMIMGRWVPYTDPNDP
jgi:hypothetical protein